MGAQDIFLGYTLLGWEHPGISRDIPRSGLGGLKYPGHPAGPELGVGKAWNAHDFIWDQGWRLRVARNCA